MSDQYSRHQDYDADWDYGYQPDEITIIEWWEPGPYTGVGPANYQPSDERILESLNDRLFLDGSLDASQVNTRVEDGVVTLSGSVPSRQDKRRAEDIAESVYGVEDVHNNLSVNKQGLQTQPGEQRARLYEQPQQYEQRRPQNQPRMQARPQRSTRSAEQYERFGAQTPQYEQQYMRREGRLDPYQQLPDQRNERGQQVIHLTNQGDLRRNMRVIGWDNELVGFIKEFYQDGFLVDRVRGPDVFVPYSSVYSVGQRVHLNVTADSLEGQTGRAGWNR